MTLIELQLLRDRVAAYRAGDYSDTYADDTTELLVRCAEMYLYVVGHVPPSWHTPTEELL